MATRYVNVTQGGMNRKRLRREANKFLVWRAVKRHRGHVTVEDLTRITGLTRATVVACLGELKIARKRAWANEYQHGLVAHMATDSFFRLHGIK